MSKETLQGMLLAIAVVLVVVVAGNAGTATKLKTARKINGTDFDGSGAITTNKWGASRKITLDGVISGSADIDGSENKTINTTAPVQTAKFTVTKSNIKFTLKFKRNMNLVTVNVIMEIPSTVTSAANWLTSSDFTMPEWAKTNDNEITNLDTQILSSSSSAGNDFVGLSDLGKVALSRASSNDYRLLYTYNQAQNMSYPDGHTLIFNLKYIVN